MIEKKLSRKIKVFLWSIAVGLPFLFLALWVVAQATRPIDMPAFPIISIAESTVSYDNDNPTDNNFYVSARSGSAIIALQEGFVSSADFHAAVALSFPDSDCTLLVDRSVCFNVQDGQKISKGDIIGWFPATITGGRIFVGVLGDAIRPEDLLKTPPVQPTPSGAGSVLL